jgi:hypothetical protein
MIDFALSLFTGTGAIFVMQGRSCCALAWMLLSFGQASAEPCVQSELLAPSTASITRYLDSAERAAEPNLVAIQGTGWFTSPTTLVTVEHVATAMGLSTPSWKLLTIQNGADNQSIFVRIQRLTGGRAEKLAVIELQTAVSTAQSLVIRRSPLAPEDRVMTLAYPNQQPRSAGGRFVQYVDDGELAGRALLEMYDGNNRLAIDHGASGAPVFDCEGRVAAVISNVITQNFPTPFGNKRISTAWGSPNVVSVPVRELME